MKKKQLTALFMAAVLAVLSPAGAYAAEFSDSTSAQETGIPDETTLQNDVLAPDEYITESKEIQPEEETEIFSSGQLQSDAEDLSDAEGLSDAKRISDAEALSDAKKNADTEVLSDSGNPASAVSDSDIAQVVDSDRINYVYIKDKDSYMVEGIYNPGGEKIVIPAEYDGKKVTEISYNVYWPTFEDQDELTILTGDLVLPEGLLVIQDYAFSSASFMSLYVPDSVNEIGKNAFYNCDVRWLHFPAGMPVIPSGLFKNCPYLETVEVPEGVTELTSGAFKECTALKYLYLPASMTKIGEDLFAENAQVTIYGTAGSYAEEYARAHNLPFSAEKENEPAPNQETLIQNGVRYTYDKPSDSYLVTSYTGDISEEITIPETINNKPVSGIGEKAFVNCYRLRRVILPSTIKSIGEYGFSQCLNLEEINLPDGLQSIGSSAFTECALKYAAIPDSVKTFGTSIFYMCFNLEEVRLPKGMTSIPEYMFYWTHISKPLSLPSGIKSIGDYAFSKFVGEIPVLPSGLVSIGDYAFSNSSIEAIKIPNSVTKMGKEVFSYCFYLRTVTWGKGLKTIPQGTFASCLSLEEMRLPTTVTTIGKNAYNRSDIRRLSIPKSVKKIDKTAFKDCANLTLFVAKGSYAETFAKNNKLAYDNGAIANAIAEQGAIRYEYNSSTKTYTVLEADKNIAGDISIPGTINGKKVITIEKDAFRQCEKLRSVKLPNTITAIGTQAFYLCSSLEQINFPASLTTIGENAFTACKFKSVSLPATIKSIGDRAFSSCDELEEIQFAEGFTEIPNLLCSYSPSLSKITLPGTLKKIGYGAFENTAIASVKFPDTLTSIGSEAFQQCQLLKDIQLPKKLTSLGSAAFSSCVLLKQVSIPAGVKTFSGAFSFCTGLEKIEIETGVEKIDQDAFKGCDNLKEIHIPESVYSIETNEYNPLPPSCVIYGKTGSSAEEFANLKERTFISEGASVLGIPVLSRERFNGNCIRVTLNKRCYNAQSYDYVLTKDSKFPTSGKYLFRQNDSMELTQEFNLLDKGTYYVFARSSRLLKDGQREYSPWSKGVKTIVSTQAPKPPTVKSVTVKGKTVTVVLNKAAGTTGYSCVLAYGTQKEGVQKLLAPSGIRYTASSSTTKLVFKNVKKGSYKILVRGYVKQKNGAKVMSKWRARTARVQVK